MSLPVITTLENHNWLRANFARIRAVHSLVCALDDPQKIPDWLSLETSFLRKDLCALRDDADFQSAVLFTTGQMTGDDKEMNTPVPGSYVAYSINFARYVDAALADTLGTRVNFDQLAQLVDQAFFSDGESNAEKKEEQKKEEKEEEEEFTVLASGPIGNAAESAEDVFKAFREKTAKTYAFEKTFNPNQIVRFGVDDLCDLSSRVDKLLPDDIRSIEPMAVVAAHACFTPKGTKDMGAKHMISSPYASQMCPAPCEEEEEASGNDGLAKRVGTAERAKRLVSLLTAYHLCVTLLYVHAVPLATTRYAVARDSMPPAEGRFESNIQRIDPDLRNEDVASLLIDAPKRFSEVACALAPVVKKLAEAVSQLVCEVSNVGATTVSSSSGNSNVAHQAVDRLQEMALAVQLRFEKPWPYVLKLPNLLSKLKQSKQPLIETANVMFGFDVAKMSPEAMEIVDPKWETADADTRAYIEARDCLLGMTLLKCRHLATPFRVCGRSLAGQSAKTDFSALARKPSVLEQQQAMAILSQLFIVGVWCKPEAWPFTMCGTELLVDGRAEKEKEATDAEKKKNKEDYAKKILADLNDMLAFTEEQGALWRDVKENAGNNSAGQKKKKQAKAKTVAPPPPPGEDDDVDDKVPAHAADAMKEDVEGKDDQDQEEEESEEQDGEEKDEEQEEEEDKEKEDDDGEDFNDADTPKKRRKTSAKTKKSQPPATKPRALRKRKPEPKNDENDFDDFGERESKKKKTDSEAVVAGRRRSNSTAHVAPKPIAAASTKTEKGKTIDQKQFSVGGDDEGEQQTLDRLLTVEERQEKRKLMVDHFAQFIKKDANIKRQYESDIQNIITLHKDCKKEKKTAVCHYFWAEAEAGCNMTEDEIAELHNLFFGFTNGHGKKIAQNWSKLEEKVTNYPPDAVDAILGYTVVKRYLSETDFEKITTEQKAKIEELRAIATDAYNERFEE